MDIKSLCTQAEPYIIEMRRWFHLHPEVSLKEVDTSKKIREELDKMGIPYDILADNIGVVATIKGGKPGKKIGIRADIDALPVIEDTGLDFKSQNEGVMHACGHDAHAAMLLGVAKVLNECKENLSGSALLIFQSAEELALGVQEVLDYLSEKGGVDAVFGTHIWSAIPSGEIKLIPGPLFTGGNAFYIHLYGKGGHGARPDLIRDPVKAACDLVLQLSAIPSNYYNVLDNSVVSVGCVQAGTFENVFPGEAFVSGTTRHYKPGGADKLKAIISRMCEGVARIHDVEIDCQFNTGVIPVINDEEMISQARQLVSNVDGLELHSDMNPVPAGDNIGFLMNAYKGFYALLGGGIPGAEIYPQHHAKFDVDESAFRKGTEFMVNYVCDFLK